MSASADFSEAVDAAEVKKRSGLKIVDSGRLLNERPPGRMFGLKGNMEHFRERAWDHQFLINMIQLVAVLPCSPPILRHA